MTSSRIGIIAAMPGEVAPLIKRTRARRVPSSTPVHLYHGERFVIAYAGIGERAALAACDAALRSSALSRLVSVGWVGALQPTLSAGSLFLPASITDEKSGASFPTEHPSSSNTLVTVSRVISSAEKSGLAARFHAAAVDMEAAHVAQFAQQHGLPFACIRAVSDAIKDVLPDMNLFTTDGRFDTYAFAQWLALRPRWWPAVVRLGLNSARAARAIADELLRSSEV